MCEICILCENSHDGDIIGNFQILAEFFLNITVVTAQALLTQTNTPKVHRKLAKRHRMRTRSKISIGIFFLDGGSTMYSGTTRTMSG